MQEQQVINNNPVGSEKHQAGAVHMLLISVCSSLLWLGSDFYLFFFFGHQIKGDRMVNLLSLFSKPGD